MSKISLSAIAVLTFSVTIVLGLTYYRYIPPHQSYDLWGLILISVAIFGIVALLYLLWKWRKEL